MTRPLRIGEAIDLFLGDLARQGRKSGTLLDYRYKLNLLADDLKDCYVDEIELADYERFLNRWVGRAASTLAGAVSLARVLRVPLDARLHDYGCGSSDQATEEAAPGGSRRGHGDDGGDPSDARCLRDVAGVPLLDDGHLSRCSSGRARACPAPRRRLRRGNDPLLREGRQGDLEAAP